MAKTLQRCGTCFYSRMIETLETAVVCQRFPPYVTKVEGSTIRSDFPLMNIGGWCGEWKMTQVGRVNDTAPHPGRRAIPSGGRK